MTIAAAAISTLRSQFGDTITTGQLWAFDKEICRLASNGSLTKIRRGVFSLVDGIKSDAPAAKIVSAAAPALTRVQLGEIISDRFQVMDLITDGLITGDIRSLMISGAAGVGKTFTLEKRLEKAELEGKISGSTSIGGSISAIGLYTTLFNNRKKGQVVILDDINVFDDEETMNILKKALDSSKVRRISWIKKSAHLEELGIPNDFEYSGQIVFLTNTDIEQEINKPNSRKAPHLKALLSRSVFLDLAIHTNEQIMIRVEQVLRTSQMTKELRLNDTQRDMVIDWMWANVGRLRAVSLRTVIAIAGFVKTTDQWERIARTTMLTASM